MEKRKFWLFSKLDYKREQEMISEIENGGYVLQNIGRVFATFFYDENNETDEKYDYFVAPSTKSEDNIIAERLSEYGWVKFSSKSNGKIYFRRNKKWEDSKNKTEENNNVLDEENYVNTIRTKQLSLKRNKSIIMAGIACIGVIISIVLGVLLNIIDFNEEYGLQKWEDNFSIISIATTR